jgi:methylaspartate mutase epsilon subunit
LAGDDFMEISNKKLPLEQFFAERQEVLKMWPTGSEVDLEDAFHYHRAQGLGKNMAAALQKAHAEGRVLIALRAGKPTVERQIEDLLCVQEAGADLLPVTVDSYSRNLRFKDVENALQAGKDINGYPVVNHGVKGGHRIMEAVGRPVTVKHGSTDARLVAEIAFASGMSDLNGNIYSWGLTYNKNVSLVSILKVQQYIDRLAGHYAENGIIIAREQGGGQGPGNFRVPCISLSNTILGALISAGQGVKATQTAYGQGTNLVQDVASLKMLRKLGEEYFQKYGFGDVQLTTIFHQWMGAFPEKPEEAMGVICLGATTGVLGGADQIVVKSTQEGVGVPSKEANAAGVAATKKVIDILGKQRMPDSEQLQEEMEIIEAETRAIIDAVLEMGDGDPALGTLKGIETGIVEVPFTPSIYNYGKAILVRDANGAYRFLDAGNLPLPKRVLAYHRRMIDERSRMEGGRPPYEMVLDDVYAMLSVKEGK